MRILGGFIEENIVHDHDLHRAQRGGNVMSIRIGLRNILALDIDSHETAVERGVEHVGDAQSRFGVERNVPRLLELGAHGVVGDVAIAGQFMRERADVVRALHVILSAQRIDADARTAEVSGQHREVGHRQNGGAALAMLGDS